MSEIQTLKDRIQQSGPEGIETAIVRDDYEPVGAMMIRDLCDTGEYVQRKAPMHSMDSKWRIFKAEFKPY